MTIAKPLFFLLLLSVPCWSEEIKTPTSSGDKAATTGEGSLTSARVWPHELSDLKPDPKVVWGKLDNGLRYAILRTNAAPARASLRMVVLAGSGMEEDDQQGMAHFLEHMAFNGTKNFPPGETFEYFQRLGMAFGAHTNAVTEIDNTIYHLELPRADEKLTGDGLQLFRDFLDGMLLRDTEIEKERGVVLSEQIARNTAAYRSAVGSITKALAGTRYEHRLPLGKPESIRKVTRERLVDFYETWYTPGRTVIVAVGDFDAAMVEAEIRKRFADAKARRGEAADPNVGTHVAGDRTTARFNPIVDADSVTVTLCNIRAGKLPFHSLADAQGDILNMLVNHMIAKRLDKLIEMPGSPIQTAAIENERLYNLVERNHFSALCRPEQWAATVGLLEQEMRRALMYGFTPGEVASAKADLENLVQVVVSRAETRQPAALANELVKNLLDQDIFMHPNQLAPMFARFLPSVDKAECDRQLRTKWDAKDLEVSVSGNVKFEARPEEQVLAVYAASAKKPVEPLIDDLVQKFPYTNFGPAGKVVRRTEQKDLGIVQAEFANHVRVNIKTTSFEKDRIRVCVRFGGGTLELPLEKPGLQHFAGEVFIAGGLKELSFNDLARQVSNKSVGIGFAVGDDAFELSGSCAKASLELQLQLCTAYLTVPGYRPEPAQRFREAMEMKHTQRENTAEGVMTFDGRALLRSGDHRFVLPSRDQTSSLTLTDVKAWLAQPLAEGYLEVTIVGDVEAESALKLLSTTLGALPARAKEKPTFAAARNLSFPTGPKSKEFRFQSATPRALSVVVWPVAGAADTSSYRRLTVLKQILADRIRLKLREDLGATYTPSVVYEAEDAYPQYGYIAVELVVDPNLLPQVGPLVKEVAAELAVGAISDDEFHRATQPLIDAIDSIYRNNSFWLAAICDCQERPRALADIRTRATEYGAIKKSEIERLAKQYLAAENATQLTAVPSESGR